MLRMGGSGLVRYLLWLIRTSDAELLVAAPELGSTLRLPVCIFMYFVSYSFAAVWIHAYDFFHHSVLSQRRSLLQL